MKQNSFKPQPYGANNTKMFDSELTYDDMTPLVGEGLNDVSYQQPLPMIKYEHPSLHLSRLTTTEIER